MNKKLYLLFAIFFLFVIPFTSAFDLTNPSTWDDEVKFHETSPNGKFGYYEIADTTLWVFNKKQIKTVELIENDYSIFTAWNIKQIEIFQPTKLFDKTEYFGADKKTDKSSAIKSTLQTYREWEVKTKMISEGHCEDYFYTENGTEYCSEWVDTSYEEEYEGWNEWKSYDFKIVQPGIYQTKTLVTRSHQNTGIVDWIDTSEGHNLDRWATWWDNGWNKKRMINITETSGSSLANYSVLLYIPYNSSMKTDFSDLRFLNSLEDTELGYWIENKTDSSFAWVWVRVPTLTASLTEIIYIYYGNSGASSNSNGYETFIRGFDDASIDNSSQWTSGNVQGSGVASISWNAGGYYTVTEVTSATVAMMYLPQEITSGVVYLEERLISKTDNNVFGGGIWNSSGNAYVNFVQYQDAVNTHRISRYISETGSNLVGTAQTVNSGVWYNFTFIFNPTTMNSTISSLGSIQTTDSSFSSGHVGVSMFQSSGGSSAVYELKNLWVNAYTSSPPTSLIGEEQSNQGVSTTLITPESGANFLTNDTNFTFTSTPSRANLTNATIYLWNATDDSIILTNFTTLSGNESINTTFTEILSEGSYLWNAQTCGEGVPCSNATTNNSFTLHFTSPTLLLLEPTSTTPFFKLGENETLNWLITEPGENLTEHLVECIYEYNGTVFNVTDICITTNSTNFTYAQGVNNLTFNVTDSFGLVTSNTTSWIYDILEIATVFDSEVLEASTNTYQYHFITPFSILAAQFNYNSTSYTASIASNGTNQYRLDSTIQVPNVALDVNLTLNFGVQTDNNGLVNSTEYNQTVQALSVDNCSTFTNEILTASLFNERTLENINGTVEANFELLNPTDFSTVSIFTTLYENVHTLSACTNINISEKNFLYNLEMRYYQNGTGSTFNYVPEFYHIQRADTVTLPQNISLYDLNVNESSEFTIFYRDNNYVTKPNVLLQILRNYVAEGIFRVIEIPITSSEGSAVAHFDLNNYKYKIIVTENGEVLNVFDNPTIRCESEISGICVINLKGEREVPQAESVAEIEDFEYFPSLENETITITFSSPTGTNKQVRTEMVQTSPFSNPTLICNKTILSSAGSVSCDAVSSIGDSLVTIKVYVDGEVQANLQAAIVEDLNDSFMLNNYFLGAILLMLLIGMAVSSPQLMPWVGIFGLILLGFIFLLKSSSVGLMVGAITWFVVAAIIITFKISKRTES